MKLVFMGTPAAAVRSLERLIADGHEIKAVYTQPDRPSGRGNKILFSPVKELAIRAGLPVLQPEKVRTPEAAEHFRSLHADGTVVVAYGRILPAAFLNAFPAGAINVHFSLLPHYRGAAPVNWAIANGETETGVTTMVMDEGLDTGPVLLQERMAIGDDETSIELMSRLSDLGAELLSRTLTNLGKIVPRPQEHENASLAPILSRAEGLIDWNLSAAEIVNRVRGFQPFPMAYTFFSGKRLVVWKAAVGARTTDQRPGTVADSDGNILTVACGRGTTLEIIELQVEGKRRMSTRDFINGVMPKKGILLG